MYDILISAFCVVIYVSVISFSLYFFSGNTVCQVVSKPQLCFPKLPFAYCHIVCDHAVYYEAVNGFIHSFINDRLIPNVMADLQRSTDIYITIESCQKPLLPISSETARGTAAKFCMPTHAVMG